MIIRHPQKADIPQLKALWMEAFAEPSEAVDAFLETAFFPENSLLLLWGSGVAAALYWLDAQCCGKKLACLYAVAVKKDCRGRGLGITLLEEACKVLKGRGYEGVLLIPGDESLYTYYNKVGFAPFGHAQKVLAESGEEGLPLQAVNGQTYLSVRKSLFPGIHWDEPTARYLQRYCRLFAGQDFVLALDGTSVQEYLGKPEHLPKLLHTLKIDRITARLPGGAQPAGMVRFLNEEFLLPDYFGPMMD